MTDEKMSVKLKIKEDGRVLSYEKRNKKKRERERQKYSF